MVVELVFAGAVASFGAITLVGNVIARVRTRRLAMGDVAEIKNAASPYRSPGSPGSPNEKRVRTRPRARNEHDLMIGRTLYR